MNFNLIITTLWEVAKSFMPIGFEAFAVLFLLVGVPCAFSDVVVVCFCCNFCARLVSGGLSGSLNSLVMQQLRQTGLGGNVRGETAVGAEPFPAWLQERFPPLPDELGREISDTSNKAASQVIEKFRSLIGALAFADAGLDGSAGQALVVGRADSYDLFHCPTLPSSDCLPSPRPQASVPVTRCNGIQIMHVPNNGMSPSPNRRHTEPRAACHGVAAAG